MRELEAGVKKEEGRKEGGSLPIKAICGFFQKQQVWA
jgi:hypothetical protein